MIAGYVTEDGIPVIVLEVDGSEWRAVVDTGFNGDVGLPESLKRRLNGEFVGRVSSLLAAGQQTEEDVYLIDFPFDDQALTVQATFVTGDEILVGTHILRRYRLQIDFPAKTVAIEAA